MIGNWCREDGTKMGSLCERRGGQAGMRVAGLTANCDAMGSSLMLKRGIGGSGGGG